MNSFFVRLGFEKEKNKFFRNLDDYTVVVEMSKEHNYTIIEGNLHKVTNFNYYNIYVSVYHKIEIKAFSLMRKDMGAFYPLTSISDVKESEWLENNPYICDSMKNAFLRFVFNPLFVSKQIFEYLYNLDLKRFGEHRYDSDALLMASYEEKRYSITKKCLHVNLVIIFDPYCRADISKYDLLTIEDLIVKLNSLKRKLNDSESFLLDIYKDIYFKIKSGI